MFRSTSDSPLSLSCLCEHKNQIKNPIHLILACPGEHVARDVKVPLVRRLQHIILVLFLFLDSFFFRFIEFESI